MTPHPIRWLVLFGVWGVYFCFGLTMTGLAPLVEPITRDLGISHGVMGGVLGIWQLVYIVAAIPCGAFLDRVGARRALFLGAMIIAVSGVLRGLAQGPVMLYLAVALFGLGGPIVSAGAPKVIARWFEGEERGLAMGIYITGPSLGAIAAFSLTNAVLMPLLDHDWRLVLQVWALVPLAAGVIWLTIAGLPVVRLHDDAEDRAAHAQDQGHGAAVLDLVRIPAVRLLLVMSVGIFTYNHALNNWLPEILRASGMTAVQAGYWATIPPLIGIAGSLLIPRFATPERRFAILAGLLLAALLSCLLIALGRGPGTAAGLVMMGIARSSLMTIAVLILVETPGIGPERAGTASGLFFSAAEIGGAGGPFAMGLLYDLSGGFTAGLSMLALVCIVLLLCVAVLSRLVRRAALE